MNTPIANTPTEVTVLTQPDCAFCDHASAVLARVGHDHPLTVRHVPLDSDEGRTLATHHGVLFAPGILLNGALLSYGRLSERRLRRHLDTLETAPRQTATRQTVEHR